jgi:hypothetical protein
MPEEEEKLHKDDLHIRNADGKIKITQWDGSQWKEFMITCRVSETNCVNKNNNTTIYQTPTPKNAAGIKRDLHVVQAADWCERTVTEYG